LILAGLQLLLWLLAVGIGFEVLAVLLAVPFCLLGACLLTQLEGS